MTQEEILALVSNNLKYSAIVYNQLPTPYTTWDGNFKIEYLYEEVPRDSLIFMVPKYSSLDIDNKLTIRYLIGTYIDNGIKRAKYKDKTYTIYVENSEGNLTKASRGDIVANRLAIFRFLKGDEDTVFLVNSPLINEASLSRLLVTNDAKFYNIPKLITETGDEIPLATNIDLLALANRVTRLENKFIYGTESPEDALKTAEIGTIYIQVSGD